MALLFNHLKDWFCAVTQSSEEVMIAVLNMSHYIQRRVMFLTSIALMAEPSSPAEVSHFIISHQSSCWVEAHVTAKWLWHRIGKNNQHPLSSDYINGQELAKFSHADGSECWLLLDTCTKTQTAAYTWAVHPSRLPFPLWSFPAVSSTDVYCRNRCKQIMLRHKSSRKELNVNTACDPSGFLSHTHMRNRIPSPHACTHNPLPGFGSCRTWWSHCIS